MPQFPILVPVLVLGITVGSMLRGKSPSISKKKFAYATLGAGLLNVAYAYAFLLLFPSSTPTFARANFAAVSQISEPVFLSASFLVAVLMVVAVLGIAQVYVRLRKGSESEEPPEVSPDEDSKLAG